MAQNWLRQCALTVGGTTVNGGGNNDLKIRFGIEQFHFQAPNMAHFRVYNPSTSTVTALKAAENTPVSFSAGYQGNSGLVFSGQVKQAIAGHEDNVVDSYVDVFCGDGGTSYNNAVVNKTLAAGATPNDKLKAATDAMAPFGVTMGFNTLDLSKPSYPRGIPLFGMARDIIRGVALSAGGLWSIQLGKVVLTPKTLDNPNSPITMSASTGLIGYPRQTEQGIWFRSLLNPALQPLMQVTLDPSQIIAAEQDNNSLSPTGQATNTLLTNQQLGAGTYTIFHINRVGDTRGQEWYDECLCIGQGGSLSPTQLQQGYSLTQQ